MHEEPTPEPLLVPARMINEHVYCPRLCALEWLNGEWADSADTVEGKTVHRRVDAPTRGRLPEPEDIDPERPLAVRRVELSDPALQMLARIDLVEVNEGEVAPIEYKKSVAPDIPLRAWDPERVQVCVQALLLRVHGYTVTRGFLWFAGSRTRVEVPLTASARTVTDLPPILERTQAQIVEKALDGDARAVERSSSGRRLRVIDPWSVRPARVLVAPSQHGPPRAHRRPRGFPPSKRSATT